MGGYKILVESSSEDRFGSLEEMCRRLNHFLQTKADYIQLEPNIPEESIEEFNGAIDFLQGFAFIAHGFKEYRHDIENTEGGRKVSVTCYKVTTVPGMFFVLRREENKARLQLVDIDELVQRLFQEAIRENEEAGDPFGFRDSKQNCQKAAELR